MKVHSGFLLSLSLALLAWCAGCSSTSSSSSNSGASAVPAGQTAGQMTTASSGTSAPCSLITPDEAQTAMGKGATVAPVHNPRTGDDECHVKGTSPGLEEVLIILHRADQWDAIKNAMVNSKTDVKAVSGLGDDAFAGRGIGYNARKGGRYVQVFGVLTNKDAANDKATRYLAERAIARM